MSKIKEILFIIILTSLLLPGLVQTFSSYKGRGLNGEFEFTTKPILNDSTWFSGHFQSKYEKYLNENIGLYNIIIRVNNQIRFSLFSLANADKVVVGKDKFLFEENYILATTGNDFIGDELIEQYVKSALETQERLEQNGIKFLFVFAPGKATFFEEHIPERYFTKGKKPPTNYSELAKSCVSSGLNIIDFNSWFLEMKGDIEFPLFPKAGIHWSNYGMYLCADSLVKKVESDLNQDLPEINLINIEVSQEQRYPEYDLGDLCNLLFRAKTYELAYPQYDFVIENKHRPRVLVIGDSFYWNLFYSDIPTNIFSNSDFWYYNSSIYRNGSGEIVGNVNSLNIQNELLSFEYIIVLQTDGGLNNFGLGFFNTVKNSFAEGKIPDGVQKYITAIKSDSEWFGHVEAKALSNGISIEDMILLDAQFMYRQELSNQ